MSEHDQTMETVAGWAGIRNVRELIAGMIFAADIPRLAMQVDQMMQLQAAGRLQQFQSPQGIRDGLVAQNIDVAIGIADQIMKRCRDTTPRP